MAETAEVSITASARGCRLRCVACGTEFERAEQDFRCLSCGELLEVFYPARKTGDPARGAELRTTWLERRKSFYALDQSGVWRFRELLPGMLDWNKVITLREGNTPIFELPRCAKSAGVRRLTAKHQGMNPTGSFKDTGMTAAISVAVEEKFRWVACASTGNTSASMAAYAAQAGLRSLVLIPEGKISWGKLSQALDYGALTCQLRTDFDGCLRLLREVIRRLPVYLLNSVNPYRLEGQKTAAFELLEQLGWSVPDHIVVPGGNLGNSSAIGKALLEMQELGLISRLPKVSVIQAAGANPLVRTIREHGGKSLVTMQPDTMATAIRIGNPASWRKALKVLHATGGTVEEVSEAEIALAKAEIGSDGVGCEPASAVTLAGLKKLVQRQFVAPDESVVLILTGHVLKDPEYTLKFHRGDLFAGTAYESDATMFDGHRREPLILDADADAVVRALEQAEKASGR
jgi:threonine synthase